MALRLINRVRESIHQLEYKIIAIVTGKQPPVEPCIADVNIKVENTQKISLRDIIGDRFLWAVPRNRRTIEKRWKRKFGTPEYFWKLLRPKTNLQICNTCGHDHEVGVLCPHCYEKVIKETKQMQEAIQNELKLDPVEKEVMVLYEGEKTDEIWEGKRIVEMKKPRPNWFSKNLLQKTTQGPAITKDIKPSELG